MQYGNMRLESEMSDASKEIVRVEMAKEIHYRMFSWRTACGKVIDREQVVETSAQATCRNCLRSRVHEYAYLLEHGHYGLAIEREVNLSQPVPGKLIAYTIRLFHPFVGGEKIEVFANLANDELALGLGKLIALWRSEELAGEFDVALEEVQARADAWNSEYERRTEVIAESYNRFTEHTSQTDAYLP